MKKNMIPALALGVLLFSLPSFGKMLYVSNTVGNDEYDGLAAAYDGVHGPKFKIQSAIDAAEDGDTVIVAPGTYGDEQGTVPSSVAGQTVRIWIDKAITLKSSGDRTDTFIVGKRGANDDGTGEGAVTGIQILKSVATSADNPVEIEGFTLRDCFSDAAASGSVGGVIGWQGGNPIISKGTGPWIVACTISNCAYKAYGAIGRVNAVRTFVKNNKSSQVGVNAYYCNLVFCVLAGAQGQVGLIGSKDQYAINCTIVDSTHNPCSSSCKMNFFNTVFTASSSVSVWATKVSNCVLGAVPKECEEATDNLCDAKYSYNQIAAPLFNDYRPLVKHSQLCSGASLCNRGKAQWLELVPERFRNVDFEGTRFSQSEDGMIHIGAVQTPLTPVGRFSLDVTEMADGSGKTCVCVNGMQGVLATGGGNYVTRTFFDDQFWPRCYEITAQMPEGEHLWGFHAGDKDVGSIRFPTRDGKILFAPIKGDTLEISAIRAAKVFYVNCNTGDDDKNDGLSADKPFATIQKAIDNAEDYRTLIYVAPGLYNRGATEMTAGTLPKCRIVVSKSSQRIRIVATGSAEETIIAGEPDTTSDSSLVDSLGNGPNAVRCIRFHSAAVGCVQGFTITGGHTDSSAHTGTVSWRGGGAFMSENKNCWLLDCIVTNNCSAASGAAMYGGTAVRCRFADNKSNDSGGHAFFSPNGLDTRLVGCLLSSDEGQTQHMLRKGDTIAVHCSSFAAEKADIFPVEKHSYLFNNLILNNSDIGGNASSLCASGNVMDGTKYVDNGINKKGEAYINGSAYYVDAPNGDFRISTGSDAIGAGTAWTDLASGERLDAGAAWTNYYSLLQHDFDGNGLVFTDGNPTAGAYQKAAKYLVLAPVNRPGDVTVSTVVTNMLDFGDSITVSAVGGKRKVMGLEVNGRFIDSSSYAVESTNIGMTTVKVLANTNWYVDAENGLDSDTGWTEDDAFRTLEESMKHVVAGDVVVALPGTYSEGSMIQREMAIANDNSPSPVLRSRVVVPEGVSLVSRDGAEATVIKGEHANTATKHGEGSMRCVYMHKGARLSGFTVTGGATHSQYNTANDNNSGAGIFCAEEASTSPVTLVMDCIVSNNVANSGGGGAYRGARVMRCRFFDNGSKNEGGAVANCCIYECVFDRNYGAYGVSQPYDTRGCTFGANTRGWDRSTSHCALRNDPNSAVWQVFNCLFLGGKKCPVKHVYNCIMPSEGFIYSDKSGSQNHSDLIIAEITVDSNYAPTYDSAAANAANMDYVKDWELEGDAYGNPRRSNGGMDIGAVETDWRPNYAAILGSRTSVKEASWDVVATSAPGVLIPDGGTMNVDLDVGVVPSRGTGVVRFAVGEGAVLTILRSGKEPLTYSEGIGEYRFRDMKELEQFAFSVAGGNAVLLGIDRDVSFSIVIR